MALCFVQEGISRLRIVVSRSAAATSYQSLDSSGESGSRISAPKTSQWVLQLPLKMFVHMLVSNANSILNPCRTTLFCGKTPCLKYNAKQLKFSGQLLESGHYSFLFPDLPLWLYWACSTSPLCATLYDPKLVIDPSLRCTLLHLLYWSLQKFWSIQDIISFAGGSTHWWCVHWSASYMHLIWRHPIFWC